MSECRCAEDGGDFCYQAALQEAGDDKWKLSIVSLMERSRKAQGLPFHVIDPVVLQKVARILVDANKYPKPTPEQEARTEAERQVWLLKKERQR